MKVRTGISELFGLYWVIIPYIWSSYGVTSLCAYSDMTDNNLIGGATSTHLVPHLLRPVHCG